MLTADGGYGRYSGAGGNGLPAMRQQLLDPAGPVRGQSREHILEIGIGVVPFMRADCTKLMTAAARWPARRLPANSQLALPMAIGRIWFSIQLLSTGSCPSSMKRVSAGQRLRLYFSALAVAELSGSFYRCSVIHWCSASRMGLECCWRMLWR